MASDWSDERNRTLAVALTLLEAESCNNCGTPAWLGHSSDNTIGFRVESAVCHACAELDKDREEREKSQRKARRGETRYITAHNVWGPDELLPSRHDSYQGMKDS